MVPELVARGAGLRVHVAGRDLERPLREGERLHLREVGREDHPRPALEQVERVAVEWDDPVYVLRPVAAPVAGHVLASMPGR